jgi:hypothetical protein
MTDNTRKGNRVSKLQETLGETAQRKAEQEKQHKLRQDKGRPSRKVNKERQHNYICTTEKNSTRKGRTRQVNSGLHVEIKNTLKKTQKEKTTQVKTTQVTTTQGNTLNESQT